MVAGARTAVDVGPLSFNALKWGGGTWVEFHLISSGFPSH